MEGIFLKCQDIIKLLENQSPAEYALEWDNVGLLVGRRDKEVKKILIAVDATKDICQTAIDNKFDMIITHHPMFLSKLKKVNDDTVLGDKIISLIEAQICCYAMHTNFDTKGGMAKEAAAMLGLMDSQVLEETFNSEGIGQIGLLDINMTLEELACKVKDVFGLKNVMIYGNKDATVSKVAICPGSGKSVVDIAIDKKADCLITGDIGHHTGLDAVEMGLFIIDASHYGVEKIFMNYICEYLKEACPSLEIDVLDVGVPFEVI